MAGADLRLAVNSDSHRRLIALPNSSFRNSCNVSRASACAFTTIKKSEPSTLLVQVPGLPVQAAGRTRPHHVDYSFERPRSLIVVPVASGAVCSNYSFRWRQAQQLRSLTQGCCCDTRALPLLTSRTPCFCIGKQQSAQPLYRVLSPC